MYEIKEVKGYNGAYLVDTLGTVWSLKGRITAVRRLQTPLDTSGYPEVSLWGGGKGRTTKVHQLVAEIFLGPCPEGKQCHHKDGCKTNNNVENLEYVTPKENIQHAWGTGLSSGMCGESNGRSKLDENDILLIRELSRAGWGQRAISEVVGCSSSHISHIITGRLWSSLADPETAM